MERIVVSADRRGFVRTPSQRSFTPWGFNYDHDAPGRLIEDCRENRVGTRKTR